MLDVVRTYNNSNLLNLQVVPDNFFFKPMFESIDVITFFCRLWQFVPL